MDFAGKLLVHDSGLVMIRGSSLKSRCPKFSLAFEGALFRDKTWKHTTGKSFQESIPMYRKSLTKSKWPRLLLFVFSACGGIRIGSNMPVLTAYFPVLTWNILGKGGNDTDCLIRPTAALLPKLEQVVLIYSLSVAVWLTAKHWPYKCFFKMMLFRFSFSFLEMACRCVKIFRTASQSYKRSILGQNYTSMRW